MNTFALGFAVAALLADIADHQWGWVFAWLLLLGIKLAGWIYEKWLEVSA